MENQSQIEKTTPIESTPPLQKLPNATTTLVLGICSIVGCCCYGVPGIICGIIALIISAKDEKLLKENPDGYSDAGNHKAGRICAWIGLGIFVVGILFYIIYFVIILGIGFSEGIYDNPYYY